MKGWIKVHEIFEDKREILIKASEIVSLARDYVDEEGDYTALTTKSRPSRYGIVETPEEVFALIEEAENAGADAIEGLARVLEAHMEETRAYISYIGDGDDTGDASYLRGREAALKDILELLKKETSRWER